MTIETLNGVEIGFDDVGEGDPILLLHGFASNRTDNWSRTGWYGTLQKTGRRVIAMDWRGHGESQKFHDSADYEADAMLGDVVALLDHLGLDRVEVMGFSMGGGLAMRLAMQESARVKRLICAGMGHKMFEPSERPALGEDIFDVASADEISNPTAKGFRLYAEQLGQDLQAMKACAGARRPSPNAEDLFAIRAETLIVAGQRDDLAGDPIALAERIPGAKGELIPGADHMYLLTNGAFKGTVVDFLTGWL